MHYRGRNENFGTTSTFENRKNAIRKQKKKHVIQVEMQPNSTTKISFKIQTNTISEQANCDLKGKYADSSNVYFYKKNGS